MKELIKDLKFIITACKSSEVDLRIEQLITDFIKEEQAKQLLIHDVSQQRELLKAFADVWNRNGSQLINDAHIGHFLDSL